MMMMMKENLSEILILHYSLITVVICSTCLIKIHSVSLVLEILSSCLWSLSLLISLIPLYCMKEHYTVPFLKSYNYPKLYTQKKVGLLLGQFKF